MSLHRLALRLAAVEALCPAAKTDDQPYPTIAGPKVYDTRIEDIVGDGLATALDDFVGKPLVFLYTDDETDEPYGTGRQYPDDSVVTLIVEAAYLVKEDIEVTLPDGSTQVLPNQLIYPATDRQLEASLDLLEAQVRRVFDRRSMYPSAALFYGVLMETHKIVSVPLRDADKAVRLARRTIAFTFKIKATAWPNPFLPPPVTPPGGIPGLPSPLAEVAAGLPAGSSGRALCEDIAKLLTNPTQTPYEGVDIHVGLHGPFDDPSAGDFTISVPDPT